MKTLSFLSVVVFISVFLCNEVYSQYAKLEEFDIGSDGMSHLTGEFVSDETFYYGSVLSGGANGMGYIFKMNKDGTGFQNIFSFSNSDIGPNNTSLSLTVSGLILYGLADKGGSMEKGIIFKINNDGTEFNQLFEFNGTNGSDPTGRMILLNTNLIGTTTYGGVDNIGTIFKYNINTGILTTMHTFSSFDGSMPTGGLLLNNSSLYGLTTFGGLNSEGVLFKIEYDGSGFLVLHNFIHSSGSIPKGDLEIIDSWLYGTTSSGGTDDMGTVFKINLPGTDYKTILSFSGSNGNTPQANLVLVENRLYGTTTYGGDSNEGVIFMIYKDESDYKVLHNFSSIDGKFPKSTLVASGSDLIGTTSEGGSQSGGVIFKINTGYPSRQANYLSYSNVQPNQIGLIGFSGGDGSNRTLFIKKGTTGTAYPKDGITYVADTVYGQGSQIENTGWFCIYNGTGNQFGPVTGLEPNTTYKLMEIEYNGKSSEEKYLSSITENQNLRTITTRNGIIGSSEGISFNSYATTLVYTHTIANEGINQLISNGICWAEHPAPTFNDNKYIEGSGPGVYSARIGNLKMSTQYFARTFMIYQNDTIWGNEFAFTTSDIPSSITRAYDGLIPNWYSLGLDPNNWLFGSIAGGEANKGSDAGDQPAINDIEKYMATPSNNYNSQKWRGLYESIYTCTDAIIAVNQAYPGANPEKEPLLAQLRFFRAFFYFELIKVFGAEIPWIDENNFYNTDSISNANLIWSNVENDFLYSLEYLPEISERPGYPNMWAAKAFYAKLLLYEKKYSEALPIFDDLISNGKTTTGTKYALLDQFEYNFRFAYNNSSESVFSQQAEGPFENANPGYLLAGIFNSNFGSGCCGFFQPSHFLVNSYKVDENGLPMFDPQHNTFPFAASDIKNDEGISYYQPYTYDSEIAIDPRLDWTVGRRGIMYLDWGINTGSDLVRNPSYGGCYVGVKHNYSQAEMLSGQTSFGSWNTTSLVNYNLMRFSDLLLMAAECEIEVGDPEIARSYVNQVRARADNSHVTNDGANDACNYQVGLYITPWVKDDYSKEAVRFERKLELALEGHRFFDLARWGDTYASKELNDGYLTHESTNRDRFNGVTFDSCRIHFTIPQSIEFYLPEIRYLGDSAMSLAASSPTGLPINYTVDDTTVVKLEGNKLVIVGTGTTTVTASQYIESNCIPESSVTNEITISEPVFLHVSTNDIFVEDTSGSIDFIINSNTSWLITSSEPWVIPGSTSGENDGTITLNYQSNPTYMPRTATITVYGYGVETRSVNLTQNSDSISVCPKHFYTVWEGTNGTDHMNITIVEAKLDNNNLEPGDEVGVFDGDICVGYGKVEQTVDSENILNIVVSRDDGTGNGYTSGDEISYILWDCSSEMEIPVQDVQCVDNQSNPITCSAFNPGGSSFVMLNASSDICLSVNFNTGWNIFSINNTPDSTNMKYLFQSMIDGGSLVKIQDEGGNSLEDMGVFGEWTNNIGDIFLTEGYKIKVNADETLEICGKPVDYPYAIPLSLGWNIIGYPQTAYYDGQEIVQQLIDKGTLIKVQDERGSSIEDLGVFGGWQNFIGNFVPGEGYKIKVSSQDSLWIYESYPKSTITLSKPLNLQHFNIAISGNGVDHMNFNLVNVNEKLLAVGDEISVYDGTTCVGAMVFTEAHLRKGIVSIPASATDESGMPGFTEGNPFSLRIWKADQNREIEVETEHISGPEVFTKHESVILSLDKSALTKTDEWNGNGSTEVNCYPNPFEKELVIELSLSGESEVEIEVVNQMGQRVAIPVKNEKLPGGIHRIYWDTKKPSAAAVAPGIFYILTRINNVKYTNKVVLTQ